MLVVARCPFYDLAAGELRTMGDKFTCDGERARRLAALNLVAIAKDQPEEEPETPEAPEEPEEEPEKARKPRAKKAK